MAKTRSPSCPRVSPKLFCAPEDRWVTEGLACRLVRLLPHALRLGTLLLALPVACVHFPLPRSHAGDVRVEWAQLEFPRPEQGRLQLLLRVPNLHHRRGMVRRIGWEVWVHGHWFAAGTQALSFPLEPDLASQGVQLEAPLSLRRAASLSGEVTLPLNVRGEVELDWAGRVDVQPFEAKLQVHTRGVPSSVLNPEENRG